ncbi:hypothetical protein GYMLUDRAFT_39649 [Collybiopsis luxurians FD-317 M1]|nr:hypothetical protein GYMLUDRAFT_39649 [Collybiopsis luxurians FD-317 M1]
MSFRLTISISPLVYLLAVMGGQVVAFNVVESLGLAGAFVIIITALFSRSTPRLSTWYLVLVSTAFYNLSMLLLAIAKAQYGSEPSFTLCYVQSALIYSAPIWLMGSVCTFAFQLHLAVLYYVKRHSGMISHESIWLPTWTIMLFLGVTIPLLIVGAVHPEIVQRNEGHFYCHFTNNVGLYVVSVFGVIFAIVAVTCEVKSGIIIYRHWRSLSDLDRRSDGRVSIGVFLRLAGFSLNSILSVAACGVFLLYNQDNTTTGYINIYTALVASADVPLLGFNKSILYSWMFWKKTENQEVENREKLECNAA